MILRKFKLEIYNLSYYGTATGGDTLSRLCTRVTYLKVSYRSVGSMLIFDVFVDVDDGIWKCKLSDKCRHLGSLYCADARENPSFRTREKRI